MVGVAEYMQPGRLAVHMQAGLNHVGHCQSQDLAAKTVCLGAAGWSSLRQTTSTIPFAGGGL